MTTLHEADALSWTPLPDAPSLQPVPGTNGVYTLHPDTLPEVARVCFTHLRTRFRPSHLAAWRDVYDAPDASPSERAHMRRNLLAAVESARKGVPYCQDTGTDVAYLWRGAQVLLHQSLNLKHSVNTGATRARKENPFRSSVFVPGPDFTEKNSGDNSPPELHFMGPSTDPHTIEGLFVCKGGGSGSKLWSFSEKPLLASRRADLLAFLKEKIAQLGHSACPPYHLSIVLGGLSHLHNSQLLTRLTVEDPTLLQSDPTLVRDTTLEADLTTALKASSLGAQGDGKYFVLPDGIRVVRAPRHAAHFFVAIGVSCSAHRIQRWRITPQGAFIEALEPHPERFLPSGITYQSGPHLLRSKTTTPLPHINTTDAPSALTQLRALSSGTSFLLSGPILGARDKAHARWLAHYEDTGQIPDYLRTHVAVLYVGPADTPDGDIIGSFGPTTANRMDPFANFLLPNTLVPLSIGKGSRSHEFSTACATHQGMFAAVQGGPASLLRHAVTSVEVIDYPDLGMEAVRRYTVKNMPLQMIVDAQGQDLYADLAKDFLTH